MESSDTEKSKMSGPHCCDIFVVLPPFTRNGDIIFGKNADRPQNEAQEVIFVKGGLRPNPTLQCTYITVSESSLPINDVILCKPAWMWGAEMGANDKNVAIGSVAVYTNYCEGDGDSSQKRLLGTDLVRLGLERGISAETALSIITSLLEIYGQGGPCVLDDESVSYHNSFLIADTKEAWVLETTGKLWVAEKIETGWRNISNGLSITTNIHKISSDILRKAREMRLWDGRSPFNFAECFTTGGDRIRQSEGSKLLQESSSGFDVRDMMSILRNKESRICATANETYPTQGSQVSSLSKTMSIHWFTGTTDPSISFFKPFLFTPNANASLYTICHDIQTQHTLCRYHTIYHTKSDKEDVSAKLIELENKYINKLLDIQNNYTFITGTNFFDRIFNRCVKEEMALYME